MSLNMNNNGNNQFYCHICNQTIAATMTDTLEWSCSICSSTFVERVGQGIEHFLNPPNINVNSNDRTINNNNGQQTSQLPRAAANTPRNFQRIRRDRENMTPQLFRDGSIMDILNDNQPSRNGISISDNERSNMGFVVRQVSAPQELDAITSLLLASMQASNPRPPIPIPFHNILRRSTGNNETPSFREFAEGIIGNIGMFAGNNMNGVSFDDILHHILMHESSHAGRPPASEDLIDSLDRIVVTDENVNDMGECNITLEQFQIGDIAVKLTCGHSYKEDSITHWLKMHNSCPVCRLPLGDENDSDDDNDSESDGSEDGNSEDICLPPLVSADSDSENETD